MYLQTALGQCALLLLLIGNVSAPAPVLSCSPANVLAGIGLSRSGPITRMAAPINAQNEQDPAITYSIS